MNDGVSSDGMALYLMRSHTATTYLSKTGSRSTPLFNSIPYEGPSDRLCEIYEIPETCKFVI